MDAGGSFRGWLAHFVDDGFRGGEFEEFGCVLVVRFYGRKFGQGGRVAGEREGYPAFQLIWVDDRDLFREAGGTPGCGEDGWFSPAEP